jgi:hypothetical protein
MRRFRSVVLSLAPVLALASAVTLGHDALAFVLGCLATFVLVSLGPRLAYSPVRRFRR